MAVRFTPEQLGKAAYEAYRWKLKGDLERRGKAVDFKTWFKLAPATKAAWICAANEVAGLVESEPRVPNVKIRIAEEGKE